MCAVTPRKAEAANHGPEASEAPKVEVAPVKKQAAPSKHEGQEPGLGLALAPFVAPKTDKANKAV